MCGIFGVINFDGKQVDTEKVLKTSDILAHRGPDDSGIYYSSISQSSNQSSIALAHRRLSIIDLSSSAHQPMPSEDGRYTIVYNGEIYNYVELRQAVSRKQLALSDKPLALSNKQFRTNSDTEVILKLYAELGPECLQHLRGMFAFAIWDDKEKILFAARDRFGIKPFYYLYNDKEFVFSSELNTIKHYKNGLTVSNEGIDAFLKTGSVPAPVTIYEETKVLMPGSYLEIKSMSNSKSNPSSSPRMTIKNYWSFLDLFDDQSSILSINQSKLYDNDANALICDTLLDTIKAHTVADVEVGAFLSGGIDSTSIVSLMRQAGHQEIKTISVTFPGFIYDEAEYSNVAAQAFETDHYEYRLQEHEIIDELDNIIGSMDQPTIDGINTYFVAKAAKSFGLKVVLSGLGGDELFGGYPSFYMIPKYNRLANLPFAKLAMKAAVPFVKNKLPAKAIEYLRNPSILNAEYKLIRGLFTDDELKELGWVHSYVHPFTQSTNQPIEHSLNPLQHVSYLESTIYMRNQLLRDSDVFSMAHSLELRVPFVDHILYKAVLPYLHSSYDKDETKKMLVNAVGNLPQSISGRMKMGFTFPFDVWMRKGKLHEKVYEQVLNNNMLFSKNKLQSILNSFESGKLHWSRIWALYILNRMGG